MNTLIYNRENQAPEDGWFQIVGNPLSAPGAAITKTITLANLEEKLVADYPLGAGNAKLYVRFGLSPDVDDIFVRGQQGLSLASSPSAVTDADGLPTIGKSPTDSMTMMPRVITAHPAIPMAIGLSNYVGWLVGLNPQLADNSAFPKLAIMRIAGGVRLDFPTLPNRSYQLQVSDAPDAWTHFGTPRVTAPGASPDTSLIDDASGPPKRFYRMTVNPAQQ